MKPMARKIFAHNFHAFSLACRSTVAEKIDILNLILNAAVIKIAGENFQI